MGKIIDLMLNLILILGLSSASVKFLQMVKRETLIKAAKGLPRLSTFTQQLTGQKNAW